MSGPSLGPVQVVVVDNSNNRAELARLKSAMPPSVHVLADAAGNIGFGRACNWAYHRYCHGNDLILLLNPDAKMLPGSLKRLQQTLVANKSTGAVGPQIFWDDRCRFYLPPSYIPSWFTVVPILMRMGSQALPMRVLSSLWRFYALRVWRSQGPMNVFSLSGGHVLLKKTVIERAGGLFDPRFFLYFEDTDLFVRIRHADYNLVVDPRAAVVHDFNKCGADQDEKNSYMAKSYHQFIKKHQTAGNKLMTAGLMRFIDHFSAHTIGADNGVSSYHQPFVLSVPHNLQKGWLFEWSPNPDFIPAAGCFGKGAVLRFLNPHWEKLSPGRYYGRLGATSNMKTEFIMFVIDKK